MKPLSTGGELCAIEPSSLREQPAGKSRALFRYEHENRERIKKDSGGESTRAEAEMLGFRMMSALTSKLICFGEMMKMRVMRKYRGSSINNS